METPEKTALKLQFALGEKNIGSNSIRLRRREPACKQLSSIRRL